MENQNVALTVEEWYTRESVDRQREYAMDYYRMVGASGICTCLATNYRDFLTACECTRQTLGDLASYNEVIDTALGMVQTAIRLRDTGNVSELAAMASHPYLDSRIIHQVYADGYGYPQPD